MSPAPRTPRQHRSLKPSPDGGAIVLAHGRAGILSNSIRRRLRCRCPLASRNAEHDIQPVPEDSLPGHETYRGPQESFYTSFYTFRDFQAFSSNIRKHTQVDFPSERLYPKHSDKT
jgi:hypothetical protein